MEIKGRVTAKPATESGSSARGIWMKAFLVIRYEDGQYPKDILLSNMRKAEEFERIQVGQSGTFKFDARTRQANNGKWYCELECWDWALDQQAPQPQYGGYQQGPF